MSDREFGGNDDLSLPKATVQKIINEILENDEGVSFARETRDLLIKCCVEFVTLITSEANEIAETDAKKTIACEHITTALEQLGYPEYVPEILKIAQEHKTQQIVTREKKQSKMELSGLSEEQLQQQQQELFASAADKFRSKNEQTGWKDVENDILQRADWLVSAENNIQSKQHQSGLSEHELIQQQAELFASAADKLQSKGPGEPSSS